MEVRLHSEGTDAGAIRALRESFYGPEAADRLEALDHENEAWEQRMLDYRAARRALDESGNLTEEQRAEAIASLRAERFSPRELLRVEALDRIEERGRKGALEEVAGGR